MHYVVTTMDTETKERLVWEQQETLSEAINSIEDNFGISIGENAEINGIDTVLSLCDVYSFFIARSYVVIVERVNY
ncbi:hypothetical protein LCGC14_2470330 [marine sediment metagenome]|uniref:Uncharacterized protein n=1 Tax=marine sediment metagenome TaxID=412755 RepID=A0A0F9DMN4_9ZZZZ